MADKKITQLTELTAAGVSAEDLLIIVDDPTGIPITRNIKVSSLFTGVKANTTPAKFTLDVANTSTGTLSNTGLRIEIANTTGTRRANVESFVSFVDTAANSTIAQTQYLFTANGFSVNTVGTTNSTVVFAKSTAGAATHRLKVRINNADYYIMLVDTAS